MIFQAKYETKIEWLINKTSNTDLHGLFVA